MRKLDTKPTRSINLDVIICAFLVIAIAAVYYRVLHAGFINLDDGSYVVVNPDVHTVPNLAGIAYAFRAVVQATWQPLIFLSFMCDWMFYGLNPMGYHLTNVLLHIATTLLLYYFFRRATGSYWKSAVVALLFALHPLHVESVAWISERKDTVSGLLWVLTMVAYLYYTDRPNKRRYALLAFIFAAGLLAKPMLVTLPIVLLLLDYWPLGRLRERNALWKLVREKLPLLGLALICGVIAIITQHSAGAMMSLSGDSTSARLENTVVAYVGYIGKWFWPLNLAVLYPNRTATQLLPAWSVAGSFILLLAISIQILRSKCRQGYLKVGWLWFIITLLPVIGIIQVGFQSMADRYMYIPSIGLSVMIAWGVPDALQSLHIPRKLSMYLPAIAGVILAALMALAWRQVGYWNDSITLYEHTLSVTSGNWLIENSLGQVLANKGRYDEAIQHFRAEIRYAPVGSKSYANLGLASAKAGKYDEAIKAYTMAIQATPMAARDNMSVPLRQALQTGVTRATVMEMAREEGFGMDAVQAHMDRVASILQNDDNLEEAIEQCNAAIRIDPRRAEPYCSLGLIMLRQQHMHNAYADFSKAVECNPAYAPAYAQLAMMDYQWGDYAEAWKHVHLCQKHGGQISPIDLAFLSREMPDPGVH